MVNQALVQSLLLQLQAKLTLLTQSRVASLEAFEHDQILQNAVMHLLQTSIEICLDIGQHLIADAQWRIPTSNRDVFRVLGEQHVLSTEIVAQCQNMAGFRNLVVHVYETIELADVYTIWTRHLDDFANFATAVRAFLATV